MAQPLAHQHQRYQGVPSPSKSPSPKLVVNEGTAADLGSVNTVTIKKKFTAYKDGFLLFCMQLKVWFMICRGMNGLLVSEATFASHAGRTKTGSELYQSLYRRGLKNPVSLEMGSTILRRALCTELLVCHVV